MLVGLYGCDNDYDALLEEIDKSSIELKRKKILAIEICKSINNISPNFMKRIYKYKSRNKTIWFKILM